MLIFWIIFKESISRIVAIAEEDMDEWVRVAANIVHDYPTQFVLDQRLGKVTTHFQETVHEIVSEGYLKISKTLP